jgi:hypothetical protein
VRAHTDVLPDGDHHLVPSETRRAALLSRVLRVTVGCDGPDGRLLKSQISSMDAKEEQTHPDGIKHGHVEDMTESSNDTGAMPSPTTTSKDFWVVPIPRRLRYDPTRHVHFGLALNIAFGFASTFGQFPFLSTWNFPSLTSQREHSTWTVVANLYYCQPLLSKPMSSSHGRVC